MQNLAGSTAVFWRARTSVEGRLHELLLSKILIIAYLIVHFLLKVAKKLPWKASIAQGCYKWKTLLLKPKVAKKLPSTIGQCLLVNDIQVLEYAIHKSQPHCDWNNLAWSLPNTPPPPPSVFLLTSNFLLKGVTTAIQTKAENWFRHHSCADMQKSRLIVIIRRRDLRVHIKTRICSLSSVGKVP